MKLFPVFCFERCSETKYENKKNTDFTEVSAFGVFSRSKISKFRNVKRPQLRISQMRHLEKSFVFLQRHYVIISRRKISEKYLIYSIFKRNFHYV